MVFNNIDEEIKSITKKCKVSDNEIIIVRYYRESQLYYVTTENQRMGLYILYDFKTGQKIDEGETPEFKILEKKGFESYD